MIGSVLLGRAWTQLLGQSMRIPSCVSTFHKSILTRSDFLEL
jgi:hypothetical protein